MESRGASAELHVSGQGLPAEAGWCEALADRLAGDGAPAGAGSFGLASSAAVNAGHAQIAAAGMRCTVRLQNTATKLVAAATGYGDNEARSAAEFRAVTVC